MQRVLTAMLSIPLPWPISSYGLDVVNMALGRDVHCGSGEPVGAGSSAPVPGGTAHKLQSLIKTLIET